MVEQQPAGGGAPRARRAAADRPAHPDCLLCAVALGGPATAATPAPEADGADGTRPAARVAYVGDHFLALVEPGRPGVLLAPSGHVEVLETEPVAGAAVLGALRRAASTVESSCVTDGSTIEPTTTLPGAPGHVCYRIVPTRGGRPLPPGDLPRVDPDVLAAALRQASSPATPPPG